jgi:hypothetical protein
VAREECVVCWTVVLCTCGRGRQVLGLAASTEEHMQSSPAELLCDAAAPMQHGSHPVGCLIREPIIP